MLLPSTAMSNHQDAYDDAMFDYSTGEYGTAAAKFRAILAEEPTHFDSQLSLAMCHYRLGDYPTAIAEGLIALNLQPNDGLVHTNLSLIYQKAGDKTKAEHHGLQARIAGWKKDMSAPAPKVGGSDSELKMAEPKPQAYKLPEKFPDTPWKKAKPAPAPHNHPPGPAST
jgi:Tfp pilus assembly protein PilF